MKTTFETGATSAQANNLVLSVLNDGVVYSDRCHAGFAMLQGASHRLSFKDIVTNEANKQRATGCTFKPQHITEAIKLVQADTIAHCIETIREAWNGEKITIDCRRWHDKINGNSYFSCRITVPTANGARWLAVPFQYGYGSHWEYESRAVLQRMGFAGMADGYGSEKPLIFNDGGYMLRRQMFNGLYI